MIGVVVVVAMVAPRRLWARDHRVHHKFSETPADPHNAKRGLFFAHIGWLLVQKDARVVEAGRKLDLSDLEADPVVLFQRRFASLCAIVWCFVRPSVGCVCATFLA